MLNDPPAANPLSNDDALPTDAPNSPPAQASGSRQAGRYQIGSELPGGDRLCRDRLLDRTVRVRTADSALADDLEREARFVARLEHAGIPAVHDVVRGDAGSLMVMRNVEGITLASAIEDARNGLVRAELAGPAAVLRVLAKVCDALSAAHARGVVHRAVRSDAIIVGLHGEVVLGNWRAAMVAHERPATLRYVSDMPPTQSHELDDLHTDIRAVGRCLYEALTLDPYPKDAADPSAALVASEPQRLPQRAAVIIRRAIGSDRMQGYRSADELRADLERAAAELETSYQAPVRRSAALPARGRSWSRPWCGGLCGLLAGHPCSPGTGLGPTPRPRALRRRELAQPLVARWGGTMGTAPGPTGIHRPYPRAPHLSATADAAGRHRVHRPDPA
jgi:hypothetical protein